LSESQAKGRIFQNKGRRVWMLAYCGPRPDGSWAEIRESAKTRSEGTARKRLNQRLREVANHREGLADLEAPAQKTRPRLGNT
jgi:hypothetical protein